MLNILDLAVGRIPLGKYNLVQFECKMYLKYIDSYCLSNTLEYKIDRCSCWKCCCRSGKDFGSSSCSFQMSPAHSYYNKQSRKCWWNNLGILRDTTCKIYYLRGRCQLDKICRLKYRCHRRHQCSYGGIWCKCHWPRHGQWDNWHNLCCQNRNCSQYRNQCMN
jgi:hypothetical protein